MKKTKIVVLCGSSKFVDIMAVCAWLLEKYENAITVGLHLLPIWYSKVADHIAEQEGVEKQMDELHLRKIDIADELFVINYDGYIGESTHREIEYAQARGKKIRWYNLDYIGKSVNRIMESYASIRRQDEHED